MSSQLPGARAAIADAQGLPTPEFYRFLLGLQRLSAGSASASDVAALQAQIAAIQAEIDALPEGQGYPTLQVTAPVYSQGLLQNGFAKLGVNVANSVVVAGQALQLSGDAAAPGNTWFYGTATTGAKGWVQLGSVLAGSTSIDLTVNADGSVTFTLPTPTADLSGAWPASQVVSTHLAAPLPITQGGTSAATAATALAALGALALPDPGYINGLQMAWVSATQISVSSGACYIQGASQIVQGASQTLTISSPAASTWYHVYAYNNAGALAFEIVTTAPATAYFGTARAKTGDTSRRYIGSILTDASKNIFGFTHDKNVMLYSWFPPRPLTAGTATAQTFINCTAVVPSTAYAAKVVAGNADTVQGVKFYLTTTSATLISLIAGNNTGWDMPLSGGGFAYAYAAAPTQGCTVTVYGYLFGR